MPSGTSPCQGIGDALVLGLNPLAGALLAALLSGSVLIWAIEGKDSERSTAVITVVAFSLALAPGSPYRSG